MSRGSATITTSGKKTDIRQSSDKVILDWRSFDIGSDEHTEFHQPSKNAIALNRINDTKASQINGKLTANGNIMLINPNGVVFGAGSQVDVGSLTATTADIDDDDFMAGKMDFKHAGHTAGAIVNNGNISVKDAGLVNFVAPTVENNGVIVAKLGKVQLAAADTFTLDMAGDGLLQVEVSADESQKIARNSGTISAEGGYVAVTAAKARGLIDSLVDNSGVIEASSMTTKGGKIVLSAEGGTTKSSGTIKANGKTGGGEILIGGDYQGVGDVKTTKNTEIAHTAVIEASATDVGDGGRVIVWADGNTNYAGNIKAQGGINGGNGGFVETSGKQNLHVAEGSLVTASAQHDDGEAGTWLLDPSNVTITNGSGNNIPGAGGTVNPATDGYTINAASITTALNGGNNVIITTTNGGGTEQGDITVTNATISKTTVNNSVTLSLRAARNITVENSTISSTSDSLGVTLNADRDANNTGAVKVVNSTLELNGGSFIAGGGTAPTTTAVVATQDGVFDVGVLIDNSSIHTNGAGNIILNGRGEATGNNNYGILITNNSILRTSTTGSTGTITLNGTGGAGGSNNHGVYITGGSVIRSDRGATITGTGGSNGTIGSTNNVGVYIDGNSNVQSRGTGAAVTNINITGVGGNGYSGNHGFRIDGDSSFVLVTDGDMVLNGTSGYNAALGASPGTNYGVYMSTDSDISSTSATVGEAGNITINSVGEDTVLAGDTITSVAGNITINANTLNTTLDSISSTSGNITIAPYTASGGIGLGGGTGNLNLSDAELATISTTGRLIIGKSGTGTGDIDLDSWDFSGKSYSGVELYGNDIDLGGLTMGTGYFLAYAKDNGVDYGDLNVSANITRGTAGASTLELQADRNITVDTANITATTGSLNVVLNADRNANQDGAIEVYNSDVTTNGGYFIAGGGSGTRGGTDGIFGNGDGTGADDVAAWGNSVLRDGVQFDTVNLNTGAGNVFLRGRGSLASGASNAMGVAVYDGKITTTSGHVTIVGVSGDGTSGAYSGIVIDSANGIETDGGSMYLYGYDTATHGDYGRGIILMQSALLAKNNGSIYLVGESDLSGNDTSSLRLDSSTVETRGNGTITLDGANMSNWGATASTVGGAQATGDIRINADTIDFSNVGSFQTSGNTYITPKTASRTIGLGGGAGVLNLTDAELALFNGTGKLIIGDSVSGTGDIDLDSWNWSSKLYSGIELYGNGIDLGGITMGTGSFMAYAKDNGVDYGDMNISANITRGVDGDAILDLRADRNITNSSNAGIVASDANSDADGNPATSADSLNVILNADRNANNDGAINLTNATITTLGGNFIAGGGSGAVGGTNGILGDGDGTGADDVMAWGNASYNSGVNFNTVYLSSDEGNVYISGHGYSGADSSNLNGFRQNGGKITTEAGDVSIVGYGGDGNGDSLTGVSIDWSNGIETNGGDISIEGYSGTGSGNYSRGIFIIGSSANILAKNGGSVYLSGFSDETGMDAPGIRIQNGVRVETTGAGDVVVESDWITVSDSYIGRSLMIGDVLLNVDMADFYGATSIFTAGNIYVTARNASSSIGLGGGSGSLQLDDAELSLFNGTGKLIIGDAGAGTGDIDLDSWDWSARNFSSVELYGNSIDIGGMTMGAGNFMAYAKDNGVDYGDINISANITRSVNGVSTLDLRADRNIVNSNGADIIASDANSDADGNPATSPDRLNVILNADRNADNDGAVSLTNATITTLGGNFIAGGGSGVLGGTDGILGNGDGTGADDIAAWGNSTYRNGVTLSNINLSTDAGNVFVKGHGSLASGASNALGVRLLGQILTTSGNIALHGTSGDGTSGAYSGVFLVSGLLETDGGNISISGYDISANGDFGRGVLLQPATVRAKNNGSINILGESDLSGTDTHSIRLDSSTIETRGSGSITLDGAKLSNWGASASTVGGSQATGDITLTLDEADFSNIGSFQTTGDIYITPKTASRTIGLGGGSGDLNLTDAELGYFNTTGRLIIGNSLLGTGDVDLDSWNWSSKNFSGIEIYGNDIDVGGMTMGTGSFRAHAMDNGVDYGDLNVSAAITRAAAGTTNLDLRADRNITLGSNITTTNGIMNVILNADRDADQDGSIRVSGSATTTNGGYFVAGGGSGAVGGVNGILGDGDGTGADDVAAWGSAGYVNGIIFNNADISTSAGDLILNGHGSDLSGTDGQIGIYLYNGSVLETTSGALALRGTGGAGQRYNYGVGLASGSALTSGYGPISIEAIAGSNGSGGSTNNDGLVIEGGSVVSSTGTGAGAATIAIKATGATANGLGSGLYLNSGRILTKDGDVNIEGNTLYYAGIALANNAAIEADGSADITLTGTDGAGSAGALHSTSGSIGGATATGDITLIGNTMEFSNLNVRTAGTTYVKGYSASTSIGLGGGAGDLNLSDAELGVFNGTGKLVIGDAVAGTGDIDLDSWDWSSKIFSVELYGNDIDIGGMTMGAGNFMAHARDNGVDYGDLNISANITRGVNGVATLDLRADRNITNSNGADIIATDANSDADGNPATSADSLNVILNADRNANQDGAVYLTSAAVTTLGGYFVAGGGSGTVGGVDGILGNGDGTGADDVAAWGNAGYANGIALDNGDISTGAGAMILNGHGYNNSAASNQRGLNIFGGSVLETTSGIISLTGTGGAGDDNNHGIYLSGVGTTVTSATGAIKMRGTGVSSGLAGSTNNHGIYMFDNSVVSSTGTGAGAAKIDLVGTGATENGLGTGVYLEYSSILTRDGDVDIIGNTQYFGGVGVAHDSKIEANGSANITLTGTAQSGGNAISTHSGSNLVGGAAATGDITLIGDLFGISNASFQTSGTTTVKALNPSTSIGLGGGSGTLNLDDSELALFNGTGKLVIGDALLGTGDIDLDSWNWASKNFSGIEIYGNDIDIGGLTMGAGDFMAYARDNGVDYGDLNISANITRAVNGDATLDLRADHNITNSNNANITASDANSDGDGNATTDADLLHVILNADRNGTNDAGTVNLAGGSILANGGNISIGGGNGVISAGSGFAKAPASTYFNGVFIAGTVDAQGGNVVINGDANGYFGGVAIAGTARVRTSGTGTIDIYGIGGSGNSNTRGVSTGSGSIISNNGGTGDININGRTTTVLGTNNHAVNLAGSILSGGLVSITGVSTNNGHGVNLADTGIITTTGASGALNVTGTANGTGYNGINFVTHASNTVSTESGDITLTSLAGDIVLDKEIRKTGAGVSTLTIQTPSNIVLNGEADITATNGSLNVVLNADRDANSSGAISLTDVSVATNGGYFVAGGGSGAVGGTNGVLGDGDGTGADDVAAWGNATSDAGISLDTVDINTSAGSIYMKGRGYANSTQNVNTSSASGIRLVTASLQTTGAGEINLHGIAGGTTGSDFSIGVFLRDGTLIDTENGDINIYGKGSAIGNNSHGIAFSNVGTNTVSTTDGNIDLQGEAGDPSTGSSSIYISSANGGITSDGAGDITITALNDEIRRALAGSFMIGGSSATGDISLIANTITISGMDIQTNGNMYIKAIDSTRSIGLGGGTGDLNLTDTELALFGGNGKLIIGDALLGTGDIDVDTWNFSSKSFDVELYGNDIDIGGLTMGTGDFMAYARDNGGDVADLTVSAAITRGAAGTSTLDLRADRNITFDSAASITSTTGEIDVTIDSDYNNVGGGSIVYNASSIDTNGGDITIAGAAAIGADATWNARGGTLTTGGAITMGANDLTVIADNVALSGNITGNANSILTLKPYDNNCSIGLGGGAGGFNLTDAELAGLTVGHLVIGDAASGAGDIAIQSWSLSGKSYDVELYGRDMDINGMTMGAGSVTMIAVNDVTVSGAIGNSGAGGDLYVDVGNDFENTAGASAISLGSGGRFLIYIDDLSHITRGGMTTGNLFGRDYTNDDPTTISTSFGNRFVFDETPTLTITADDVTLGAYDAGYNSFTYSLSGLATGDTAASALNGGPAYGKTQLTPTTYRITPSTGTLVSELGYLIAFQNGTLTMPVDPGGTPPPTPTPPTPTPPPAINLPPSVEHQIQLPQLLFSEGYQVITSANASFMSNNEGMLIQRKLDGFRVNTNEADAFMRMVTGGYLQIEQPVVDYYGLSSYESEEF